ncbi:MAG: precorrin-6A reductase [Hyphomonadaceae bacterium]|nr:precorrin-6A reductase [Clostridia bacterium]
MLRIWVIGGTQDSREIVNQLEKTYQVRTTVATEFGKQCLPTAIVGQMDSAKMLSFIKEHNISLCVDCSHPYAVDVSQNAMRACARASIPYLRFERQASPSQAHVTHVRDTAEAIAYLKQLEGNILLTTGSNSLGHYVNGLPLERLYVRVLPQSEVLLKCEALGLTAGNVLAIKGPFDIEMNKAMLRYCKATVLVTKESGVAGGVVEKVQAAQDLGVQVIVIDRPMVYYLNKVSTVKEVLEFVKRWALPKPAPF